MGHPLAEILLDKLTLKEREFHLPCDGIPTVDECHEAATWQALYSCGDTRLLCDAHRDYIANAVEHDIPIKCVTCRPNALIKVRVLEPIIRG